MNDNTPEGESGLTQEQISAAALPPVNLLPDMSVILTNAEKFQVDINALSIKGTENSMTQLYAITTPALELALATLAECVSLKASMSDFFKAAPA